MSCSQKVLAALWSLSEDSKWAWKQALEGRSPDLHSLGLLWKELEKAVIEEENARTAARSEGV
jgi:hypothetical protein